MSLQVFLQAQLLGTEEFLATPFTGVQGGTADLFGRCAWLTLLCEVLPRALLAELKLSRMLLGSSSAEQFLLVLAEEDIPRADEFLARAAEAIAELSMDTLRLVWASTENLGAWPVARKRLDDTLQARVDAPLSHAADAAPAFAPFEGGAGSEVSYFVQLAEGLANAKRVGWSADAPAQLLWESGEHSWP